MQQVYQVATGSTSRNLHGSWYDLTQHHLTVVGPGRFTPRFEEVRACPPLLFSMALVSVVAFQRYLEYLADSQLATPLERVRELEARIRLADSLHEDFTVARQRAV
jgi:hypothetical protein